MVKARTNEEAAERVVKARGGGGTNEMSVEKNGKETERHRHFLSSFVAYYIKPGYSSGTLSELEYHKHDDETGESIIGEPTYHTCTCTLSKERACFNHEKTTEDAHDWGRGSECVCGRQVGILYLRLKSSPQVRMYSTAGAGSARGNHSAKYM